MKLQVLFTVLLAGTLTAACSSEQLYAAGRNASSAPTLKNEIVASKTRASPMTRTNVKLKT